MSRRVELILVLFFISGFSGLIYESVWSHYVKLFLGHAAYAQTLVLVVFIGGLAGGSWICAWASRRIANPLRVYAMVELAIGLMALAFHFVFQAAVDWGYSSLLPATCEQATTFCASQWLLSGAMLAPQSLLLGATFPLVSSAVLRLEPANPGYSIATLYFLNSLGAVLGVLASAFVLIPAVGLPGTLMTAGLGNLGIAFAAYFLSKAAPPALAIEPVAPAQEGEALADDRRLVILLLVTSALTGLSSFIYEIAWIRMLSLVLGASTHSFELMLASFILGLALGGLWVRGRVDVGAGSTRVLGVVQVAMGLLAIATIPLYNISFDFMAWLLSSVSRSEGGFVIFNVASTVISLVVMLPATFCAGMTLPLITYRLLRSREGERALGTVYAVNTAGSILGVIIGVHLLLRSLGLGPTLIVGGAVDVLLGVVLLAWHGRSQRLPFPKGAVVALVLFALAATFVTVDPARVASGVFRTGSARLRPSWEVFYHRDGKTATVDVVGDATLRSIRTNGKPDAGAAMGDAQPVEDEYTMSMLAVLPLGYKPDARSAAVIGFGSGTSTSLLLSSPNLQRVDTIEIEPSMVEGARNFGALVEPAYSDPRSHIVIDDAKSYFARGRGRYDIIVSEPSNPWVSGVASLFTEEFYQRLSGYMNDGGVLAQWLHAYEIDTATVSSIVAALEKTFPQYVMYMPNDADIVLIARKGGAPGDFDASVLEWPKLKPVLARLKMTDPDVVRRRVIASSSLLGPYFATYRLPANSDYFPIVDRRAAKTRFTRDRATDFQLMQASPVPILEMLDGQYRPAARRSDAYVLVQSEMHLAGAWASYDGFFGTASGSGPSEDNARFVRLWTTNCSDRWGFDGILPSMVSLAEDVNTQLRPDTAGALWSAVSATPCGSRLTGTGRSWLELLDAVAHRDAPRMARSGADVLSASKERDGIREYAYFATVTALVCMGDMQAARQYLQQSGKWVRADQRLPELRLLSALSSSPRGAVAARCRK
jgi:spermidine synthase